MLDPGILEGLLSGDQSGPPVGTHTAGRGMREGEPTRPGAPAPGEMVAAGNSLAPADGDHEPSEFVGSIGPRSQTAAAADPGTDIRESNGEVRVPTGPAAALPLEWSVFTMRQSTGPGEEYIAPTLHVAGLANRDLYHVGNPRSADPGPESQGSADLYSPAPGAPLGTRRGGRGAGRTGPIGFLGKVVTRRAAARRYGTRERLIPKLPKLPGRQFSPGNRNRGVTGG